MARMTLNINTGAKSRTSLVINAFVVLLLTFVLFPYFKFLPQPVIGAVLVPVAVSMIKRKVYVHYWKMDKSAFIQCMVVFLVCVFVDPTYAIIVAIILGCLREAGNMRMIAPADCGVVDVANGCPLASNTADGALPASSGQNNYVQLAGDNFEDALRSISKDGICLFVYRPHASWTFTNKSQHAERIGFLRKKKCPVMISLVHMHYMDLDGLDALGDIYDAFKKEEVSLVVCDYTDALQLKLEAYAWFKAATTAGSAHKHYGTAVKMLQGSSGLVSTGKSEELYAV
jgi:MFS superfamily sulfate permease-like transporter